MLEQKFRTTILAGETKNVAGIEVPSDVIGALNAGQRPRVSINVNGYDFVSTIGKMGGKHLIALSAEHRKISGLSGGDAVEVRLSIAADEPPLAMPDDLEKALQTARQEDAFANAARSRKKEWIRQVVDAKAAETRARRILNIISTLRDADK